MRFDRRTPPRFGRLNRKGRALIASAIIVASEPALKADDPVYGNAMPETWAWLNEVATEKSIDFGIAAFKRHWDSLDAERKLKLLALLRMQRCCFQRHLDALCQTQPEPEPSPDVSFFIHGPQRDNFEVQVCSRTDLGTDEAWWPAIASFLPPTSAECMTVPLRELRRWMHGEDPSAGAADVAVRDDPPERSGDDQRSHTPVLIWRGTRDSEVTTEVNDIRPGDTVIIPTASGGWNTLGHIPSAPVDPLQFAVVDVAERATRERTGRSCCGYAPMPGPREGARNSENTPLRHPCCDEANCANYSAPPSTNLSCPQMC